MKKMKLLFVLLLVFAALSISRIERYSLYTYHLDEAYIALNTEEKTLVSSTPMQSCDTYVCVDSQVDVYYNDQSRVYFMLAEVTFTPNEVAQADRYVLLHQITIDTNLDTTENVFNQKPRIINALSTNPLLDNHVGLNVHTRNLTGERDMSMSHDKVGYRMTGSAANAHFRGVFDFYDQVSPRTVKTYFVYESTDETANALQDVTVQLQYRHHQARFLWFDETTRETVTHVHRLFDDEPSSE